MGKFRQNVIIFGAAFVCSMLLVELTGLRESMGVSWRGVLSTIPVEVAIPLSLFVGVIWVLNP